MTIIFCTTVPITFGFSTNTIHELKSIGHKIILISSAEGNLNEVAHKLDVDFHYIPFYRGINPKCDIKALLQLSKFIKATNPDIIIGATPKAAMISMIAAKLNKIPNRIYHIYGLPYETAAGIKLTLLKGIERLTGACASIIIPIGSSVKDSILNNHLFNPNKIRQTGLLTVGGVDINRFDPDRLYFDGKLIREEIGCSDKDIVIGYVARYTYDKGFCDMIELWNILKLNPQVHLLMVGSMDERVPLDQNLVDNFFSEDRVHNMGFRKDVERMFAAMDIFLFPSYREGFGNVSIEASAMKIPVVTYDVTGCRDAVENGVTGYTVPFKDYDSIIKHMKELIKSKELRTKLGNEGRIRVKEYFTRQQVTSNFIKILKSLHHSSI